MYNLQRSIIAILFLVTATTYSQVGLAPSAPNTVPSKITSAYQGVYIPNVTLTSLSATPASIQKNAKIASLLINNTATTGSIAPGYYFWNGTQWEVFDTTITTPNVSIATTNNTTAVSNTVTLPSVASRKTTLLE